jgi:hypothetical protein
MGFSPRVLPSIETFVAEFGIRPVPAEDGSYSFAFERTGMLSLVASEDGERVLMSLGWSPAYTEARQERRLLEAAGYDAVNQAMLHAGKSGDGMLLLTYDFTEDQVSPQVLDSTFRRLIELREGLR